MNSQAIKKFIKPLLGLALLGLLVSQLDITKLAASLLGANWGWFGLAVLLATSANITCAYRWRRLSADSGLNIPPKTALRLYFQGVAANTILPGGIIGGDVWRTLGLSKLGLPKLKAAKTVFLDRVSGFWALGLYASCAMVASWAAEWIPAKAPEQAVMAYGAIVFGVALAPIAGLLIRRQEALEVLRTAGLSLGSQGFTILAFSACLAAVGASIPLIPLAAVCAGIFLGAVAPAAIGGFGSREVAAVFFLSVFAVQPELGFLGSVLFGLTTTIQGALAILLAPVSGSRGSHQPQ